MRVLVACEYSGRVREAFRRVGHLAYSCDLLPSEDNSPHHFQKDLFYVVDNYGPFDLIVAHPPCTYLCGSGLHWNKKVPGRSEKTQEAVEFVEAIMSLDATYIALENPVGCLSSMYRKPDQIIQPYWFGEDASKKTCLWLKGLPKLVPTSMVEGRLVDGKRRWANQTDSGQNKLGPSKDRWKERSRTYQGIANAMADQWGGVDG